MNPISILEAPTNLGLKPGTDGTLSGVVRLPDALKHAQLHERLGAEIAGRVAVPPYNRQRDEALLVLNPYEVRTFSIALADAVEAILNRGRFPLVLGGDCSILLGNLLALKRRGRYGLVFMDGHSDLYQPDKALPGAVADMELALAIGRGPETLTNMEGAKPLVREQDVIVFGYRDMAETAAYRITDVADTAMTAYSLPAIRTMGIAHAAQEAIRQLQQQDLDGVWLHLDADVVDDTTMPAVDSRQPDGLVYQELRTVLRTMLSSGLVIGMDIAIFDPDKDPGGTIAHAFANVLVDGFAGDIAPR